MSPVWWSAASTLQFIGETYYYSARIVVIIIHWMGRMGRKNPKTQVKTFWQLSSFISIHVLASHVQFAMWSFRNLDEFRVFRQSATNVGEKF